MKITERFESSEYPAPVAVRSLSEIKSIPVYHEGHGRRHPLAAYNVSLSAVAKRFLSVLTLLTEIEQQRTFNIDNSGWEVPLLEATDHLLDSLMEHVDDCGGILTSFFPTSDSRVFRDAKRVFDKHVRQYRSHIGRIDNFIKHSQGRLRAVSFSWDSGCVLGYFVEGPIGGGVLGPSPGIHEGSNTAFSFNRDLAFHVCNVHAVSNCLVNVLHTVDKRVTASAPLDRSAVRDHDWLRVLEGVARRPKVYFPDEMRKPVPFVGTDGGQVVIEYPSVGREILQPPNDNIELKVTYIGDGVTKSFQVPYGPNLFHK